MAHSIKSIAKGSAVFVVSEFFSKSIHLLLILIYTRFLTTSDYGIIGYLQIFAQLLLSILTFGLHGAQSRFYFMK